MKKENLSKSLTGTHTQFCAYLASLTEHEFLFHKENKWSAGQQLEHIFLAVQPVRLAFSLPLWLLRLVWGKANRKSRTYDELVARYQLKLQQGGRASGRFVPKPVMLIQRDRLLRKVKKEVDILVRKANKKSESDLDAYVLPHPLLGKLTLREMLYFTNYHVEHHHQLVIQALQDSN
jgi:DinB superfamily